MAANYRDEGEGEGEGLATRVALLQERRDALQEQIAKAQKRADEFRDANVPPLAEDELVVRSRRHSIQVTGLVLLSSGICVIPMVNSTHWTCVSISAIVVGAGVMMAFRAKPTVRLW
jgi:hypothetical protein